MITKSAFHIIRIKTSFESDKQTTEIKEATGKQGSHASAVNTKVHIRTL